MKSTPSANTPAGQAATEPTAPDSQQLLRATLDSSVNSIQVLQALRDETGKIIDFTWVLTNRRWQDAYGDVIGNRFLTQNPALIQTDLFEQMVAVTQTGLSRTHEHYHPSERSWFCLTLTRLHDGVVVTTEDITSRKLAEQELLRLNKELAQQATQRYRELFDSIDQGFCTITVRYDEEDRPIDYQFNEVSPSFEYQTGIKEGAGKWMRDIAADQDQFWFDVYGRVAKDRQSERFEYFSTPLDRWWSVYAFPIESADQRRIGVLFNDISERKRSETQQAYLLTLSDGLRGLANAGQIQQAALRILGDHLRVDRVFYAEVDSDDAHLVIDTNYVRNNASSMIGRFLLSDFGQTPDVQRQSNVIADINQADELAQYLAAYRAYGIVSFMAIPLLKGGRWVASLGVHHGIPRQWTDQDVALVEQTAERTWAALERARVEEALSEANRRKDEFLALLAHELRNPLATLSNALLLLETSRGVDEQLPLEMLSMMMSREVAHLVRLVDDLLDISRISRGTLTLRRQSVDLTELVQQAVASVRPTVASAQLQLGVQVPDHSIMVEGDADRLTQVLRNLLGNAVKFTPVGGQLALILEAVEQEAMVRVTDTGIGLADSDLISIFTMFTQVDGSRTRAQGGLGLGLTLVQDIIRLHGGRVEAHSKGLGQGSEFIFFIPLTVTPNR